MTKYEQAKILGTRAVPIGLSLIILFSLISIKVPPLSILKRFLSFSNSVNAPVMMVELAAETDPLEVSILLKETYL